MTLAGFNQIKSNISLNLVSAYISKVGPHYKNPFADNKQKSVENEFVGFIHVKSGEGDVTTKNNRFHLKKNDLVFINYLDCVMISCEDSTFCINCAWFYLYNFKLDLEKVFSVPFLDEEETRMKKIITDLQCSTYIKTCEANSLMQVYLCDLVEKLDAKNDLRPYSDAIQSVIEHINMHITENVSVSELSTMCGYCKNHFSNIFRQFCGTTPKQYILNTKLQRAAYLLSNTSIPIVNISNELAFYSPAYFTNCFKKYYGKTPSEYRSSSSFNI